jgi:hypothetical protein
MMQMFSFAFTLQENMIVSSILNLDDGVHQTLHGRVEDVPP